MDLPSSSSSSACASPRSSTVNHSVPSLIPLAEALELSLVSSAECSPTSTAKRKRSNASAAASEMEYERKTFRSDLTNQLEGQELFDEDDFVIPSPELPRKCEDDKKDDHEKIDEDMKKEREAIPATEIPDDVAAEARSTSTSPPVIVPSQEIQLNSIATGIPNQSLIYHTKHFQSSPLSPLSASHVTSPRSQTASPPLVTNSNPISSTSIAASLTIPASLIGIPSSDSAASVAGAQTSLPIRNLAPPKLPPRPLWMQKRISAMALHSNTVSALQPRFHYSQSTTATSDPNTVAPPLTLNMNFATYFEAPSLPTELSPIHITSSPFTDVSELRDSLPLDKSKEELNVIAEERESAEPPVEPLSSSAIVESVPTTVVRIPSPEDEFEMLDHSYFE